MIIELAMAGYLQCHLAITVIEDDVRKCYYICQDGTDDYASTERQFQCPDTLYVDRPPLSFREQQRLKDDE